MDEKWIVVGTTAYYPWSEEFTSYEEAKSFYDNEIPDKETVYLAKVLEEKSDKDGFTSSPTESA